MGYSTGFKALDSFLSLPSLLTGGSIIALEGPPSLQVTYRILVKATEKGSPVSIDGSNTVNPYILLEEAKKIGKTRNVLKKIRICRGFTAHQLSQILNKKIQKETKRKETPLLLLIEPTKLFLEAGKEEGKLLLKESIKTVKNLCKTRSIPAIITSTTKPETKTQPKPTSRNRFLYSLNPINEFIFFEKQSKGIKVKWKGESMDFDPSISLYQTTLAEFARKLGSIDPTKPGYRSAMSRTIKKPQQRLTDFKNRKKMVKIG